jgi:hypothetical protein
MWKNYHYTNQENFHINNLYKFTYAVLYVLVLMSYIVFSLLFVTMPPCTV